MMKIVGSSSYREWEFYQRLRWYERADWGVTILLVPSVFLVSALYPGDFNYDSQFKSMSYLILLLNTWAVTAIHLQVFRFSRNFAWSQSIEKDPKYEYSNTFLYIIRVLVALVIGAMGPIFYDAYAPSLALASAGIYSLSGIAQSMYFLTPLFTLPNGK